MEVNTLIEEAKLHSKVMQKERRKKLSSNTKMEKFIEWLPHNYWRILLSVRVPRQRTSLCWLSHLLFWLQRFFSFNDILFSFFFNMSNEHPTCNLEKFIPSQLIFTIGRQVLFVSKNTGKTVVQQMIARVFTAYRIFLSSNSFHPTKLLIQSHQCSLFVHYH